MEESRYVLKMNIIHPWNTLRVDVGFCSYPLIEQLTHDKTSSGTQRPIPKLSKLMLQKLKDDKYLIMVL